MRSCKGELSHLRKCVHTRQMPVCLANVDGEAKGAWIVVLVNYGTYPKYGTLCNTAQYTHRWWVKYLDVYTPSPPLVPRRHRAGRGWRTVVIKPTLPWPSWCKCVDCFKCGSLARCVNAVAPNVNEDTAPQASHCVVDQRPLPFVTEATKFWARNIILFSL